MGSNPPLTPGAPYSGSRFERFKRWYWSHVLNLPRLSKRRRIVAYAKGSLSFHGKMGYTEGPLRAQLFHRKRGDFEDAHADCSQYAATLCHWSGVADVEDTDWTGTLGKKGKLLDQSKPGCFVFFGAPPYVHMAVMVTAARAIGFGDQAAPDESSLAGLLAYFNSRGHPGHVFRDLTATP